MAANSIKWVFSEFDDLTNNEIYQILKLRQEVFIIEQNCIYPDIDNLDQFSHHLLGFNKELLIAYLRIVPPGKKFDKPSIGRVIIAESERNKGIGIELVSSGVAKAKELYHNSDIFVEAQAHLEVFYNRIGFRIISDTYDIDGIPHIQMVLTHS
jgi:ElaA protein